MIVAVVIAVVGMQAVVIWEGVVVVMGSRM